MASNGVLPRIVCFDPEVSLHAPAPPLYPEWGERFVHCPGTLPGVDWAAVATVIAQSPPFPECWVLASRDTANATVEEWRVEIVRRVRELAGLDYQSTGTLRIVRWSAGEDGRAEQRGVGELAVELSFDGDQQRAVHLLLPIALRVLWQRDKFLETPDQRRQFFGVRLESTEGVLRHAAIFRQDQLCATASHCRNEIVKVRDAALEGRYHDWKTTACPATFALTLPSQPAFGWLYRPNSDERKLLNWLRQEIAGLNGDWTGHLQTIQHWRDDELKRLGTHAPDTAFEAGATLDGMAERFAEVDRDLAADQAKSTPFDFASQLDELIRNTRAAGNSALRKRPTTGLFAWATCLLLAVGALVAAICAAPAGASPGTAGVPWQWPLAASASVLVASVVALWAAQRSLQKVLKEFRNGLQSLVNRAGQQAEKIKTARVADVKRMILHQNQDIIEEQRLERQMRSRKIEYHVHQLERHFRDLAGFTGDTWNTSAYADDPLCLRPDDPPELNPIYFWQGQHAKGALFALGDTNGELRLHDAEARYAGLVNITFLLN